MPTQRRIVLVLASMCVLSRSAAGQRLPDRRWPAQPGVATVALVSAATPRVVAYAAADTAQPNFWHHIKRGATIGAVVGVGLGLGSVALTCAVGPCDQEDLSAIPAALTFGFVFGGGFGAEVGFAVFLVRGISHNVRR